MGLLFLARAVGLCVCGGGGELRRLDGMKYTYLVLLTVKKIHGVMGVRYCTFLQVLPALILIFDFFIAYHTLIPYISMYQRPYILKRLTAA